jgi:D-alanyl-D-alanine endopeptidase (penicillin-binding protein 7)
MVLLFGSTSTWANQDAERSGPGKRAEATASRSTATKAPRRPSATPTRQARPASSVKRATARQRPSAGQRAGLHAADDPLSLKSSVALVIDQDTEQVLFSKNPEAVLPIASITKLMTAIVVLDARLPLDEPLEVTHEDLDFVKGTRSRLGTGTVLTRREMLKLALMAS